MKDNLTYGGYVEEIRNFFRDYDTEKTHDADINAYLNSEENQKYIKSYYDGYAKGQNFCNPRGLAYSMWMEDGLPWQNKTA